MLASVCVKPQSDCAHATDGLTETNSCVHAFVASSLGQCRGRTRRRGLSATADGPSLLYTRCSSAQSTGLATFVNDVRIVDDEGKDLPIGSIGEIWIRGPNVALGCPCDALWCSR